MQRTIIQFRQNLQKIRDLHALTKTINGITTSAIDLSDIYRTEIVLIVSALDYFVHELVRNGMLEICAGRRNRTPAYEKFQVPLSNTHSSHNAADHEWLNDAIREKHSWLSFQDPDKIATAIKLISDEPLWVKVGSNLGRRPDDIKTILKLIVDRRNKIAHEADIDPTLQTICWPISDTIAENAVNEIESIVEAIFRSIV